MILGVRFCGSRRLWGRIGSHCSLIILDLPAEMMLVGATCIASLILLHRFKNDDEHGLDDIVDSGSGGGEL